MPSDEIFFRLAVLMTCHNRVANTTACLQALEQQELSGATIDLFLVDDGSTDGTDTAALGIFPDATIIGGDGSLYWCGGTRVAFERALQDDYDFYLWLNDDTRLDKNALLRIHQSYLAASVQLGEAIIVIGSTLDENTGNMSYGGWRLSCGKMFSVSWEKVLPDPKHWTSCDTMNGNCVFISRAAAQANGNLDSNFTHGIGDLDYGLRARKVGCHIVISPGYYGVCSVNDGTGLWVDKTLPVLLRWEKLLGSKGLPLKEWMIFTRRHGGRLWMLQWLGPYLKFWVSSLAQVLGIKK